MAARMEGVGAPPHAEDVAGPQGTLWGRLHGQAVLYIDDDRALLRLMARTFERAGGRCQTAATHDEGVRALQEDETLRVVLVDYEMPDGHVVALLERLRRVRPDVALVGTSGHDHQEDFARCGVSHYLPKPWRLQDLAQALGG